MNINTLPNPETVARAAAAAIANEARLSVAQRGRFTIAVSGGSGKATWMMFDQLTKEDLPWEHVHIFQVDERIAPAGSPDRNLTHLQANLSSCSAIKPEQIYAMPVEESDSAAAAGKYAELLRHVIGSPPVFDLIHLGLGPDGHTASLIPNDPVLEVTTADVAITGVYQNHQRMTLTYPVINRARNLFWVATGAEKTTALNYLLNGDACVPAGLLEQRQATLFVDQAAVGTIDLSLWNKNLWKVGIASDHGGFELKRELIKRLSFLGYEVIDFGAPSLAQGDDYPDYVIPLAKAVASKKVERGIAICGSGVGASICANKVPGARAALIHDHFSAQQGVEDDHMNILCLGGRTVGQEVAWDLVQRFLQSNYSHVERHLRRLKKTGD
ncbi:MAG: 6-phosphogluconolactonase [Chthoniobacterales bacterium]|nr:6-phosphogluconolactonase [Chthoniobacterales bacterium]